MELLWIRYQKKTGEKKYYLILKFGEEGNNILTLLSNLVPQREAKMIRGNLGLLKERDTAFVTQFIKEKCPESYQKAFRTFSKSKVDILKTFNVANLKGREKQAG